MTTLSEMALVTGYSKNNIGENGIVNVDIETLDTTAVDREVFSIPSKACMHRLVSKRMKDYNLPLITLKLVCIRNINSNTPEKKPNIWNI